MVRATASTYFRSAEPSSSGGVPTAISRNRPWATPLAASVVNSRRPALRLRSDQLVETGLVDGDFALVQPLDLALDRRRRR